MISEALAYPRRGDGWLKRIGIGGILSFFGFLIIPALLVQGYLYRVLADTTKGEQAPPDWNEWVDLLVDGVKLFIVQIAYWIVPAIILVIGFAFAASGSGGIRLVGGFVVLLGTIIGILVIYILPAALSNFAYTGELGDAFAWGTIRSAAFTGDYFVAIVVAFVLAIVLGIIGSVLSWIIIGIFVLFYAQIAVYYIFARGFVNGLDLVDATSPVSTRSP